MPKSPSISAHAGKQASFPSRPQGNEVEKQNRIYPSVSRVRRRRYVILSAMSCSCYRTARHGWLGLDALALRRIMAIVIDDRFATNVRIYAIGDVVRGPCLPQPR